LNTIPLGSNLFQASQALKKIRDKDKDTLPSPSSHSNISSGNNMPSVPSFTHPYPGYPPMGYVMPHFMPPFMPWPSTAQPPAGPGTQDPPSSPPPAELGSLEEFYLQFNIPDHAQVGLEKLGFQIGDDLSQVPIEEVKGAGIKVLDWQRILKQYRKYKHHN